MFLLRISILIFVLVFSGCKKPPRITVARGLVGPFTVETITETGKTKNADNGQIEYANISYGIKYKGQPIEFSDSLESNTGLPGIWRVFYLPQAKVPALIVGSQSLYLVYIEEGKPKIKPLHQQFTDFAAIQWLDIEDGQPGLYREIFSSDELDTELELAGGRYLALTHAVVFDTKTFEVFPFNTNNELVDGYLVIQHRAIAFSPDSSQVVYAASKEDQQDYAMTSAALVCYEFKTGEKYAVPFDRQMTRVLGDEKLYADWVENNFTWEREGGRVRLKAKTAPRNPNHVGILHFERFPGYKYILNPVKESMMDHLFNFVLEEFKIDSSVTIQTLEQHNNKISIPYQSRTFIIEYGPYENELVFYEEGGFTKFDPNKKIIGRVANQFNHLLAQGRFQDEFK